MKILGNSISTVMRRFVLHSSSSQGHRAGLVSYLANEAVQAGKTITLFLPNQLTPAQEGKEHWVQLSPFGDFGNRTGNSRVIQRFRKEDADHICNAFNGTVRKVTQPFGMPFYIGHPDHPAFSGKPGHTDTRSYGRGKEMAVHHDANCAACKQFANATGQEKAPCPDHGLFVRMQWNPDGEHLLSNESFHGHSVNWAALPDGMESGVQVYRPIKVKSAGFTNEPNIPVRPASLANAEADKAEVSSDGETEQAKAVVPPGLKLLAGFKEDDDVTMEEIIEALKKAKKGPGAQAANEQMEAARGEFEKVIANERKGRAEAVAEGLVRAGKLITKDRGAAIEQLCNAGPGKFEEIAAQLGNGRVAIKTESKTRDLANQQAAAAKDERERRAAWQKLMDAREKQFPNEAYDERFDAVGNSAEGRSLFAQMTQPEIE